MRLILAVALLGSLFACTKKSAAADKLTEKEFYTLENNALKRELITQKAKADLQAKLQTITDSDEAILRAHSINKGDKITISKDGTITRAPKAAPKMIGSPMAKPTPSVPPKPAAASPKPLPSAPPAPKK